ncbi:hypothetical protein P22_1713 [Propionispora sp. 2/2-37]|uniref:hypothetical protein n=1 Tax=Propionispora sp. 2/2-37 TaxID=1677858 RepID=UPI0006BEEA6E|nr:hypothetical protein [Propionispora sp. 2/2-37]CUH95639.1 hypothetical protein P22_1713 [Propionispora sp. 2/2-37]
MATVGKSLTVPEAGWKRYNATINGSGFQFLPNGAWGVAQQNGAYNREAIGTGLPD